ncbi:cytochrome P450 2C23-like protein [Leptotrombidium deliense]|uniref:Cytochrome P450 2C23-like protein n=1 Tax=Leptotrombidium deliense TaxID=299467 RepID=A0A443S788_9ACAR|nr:cytochrome P450 2C23-like protein [Leptotrombidium deliense]
MFCCGPVSKGIEHKHDLKLGALEEAEGESWRIQSKFIHQYFMDFGRKNSDFDIEFHKLLDVFEKYIDQQNGKAHDYQNMISEYGFNAISKFVMSKEYKFDEPIFQQILKWIITAAATLDGFNFYLSGTLFKYYFKYLTKNEKQMTSNFYAFTQYLSSLVKEREKTFDKNNCRDLLDNWLKVISENPNHEYIKC